MTDRELMQMALDYLDAPSSKVWAAGTQYKIIQALRARLAQPEQEPVAWMYDWYDETEDIDGVPIGGIVHDWISKDYDEAHSPTMGCHNIRPLYTAPPQRKWQGLTDEESFDAFGFNLWPESFLANVSQELKDTHKEAKKEVLGKVRAIEAKLKEKNT